MKRESLDLTPLILIHHLHSFSSLLFLSQLCCLRFYYCIYAFYRRHSLTASFVALPQSTYQSKMFVKATLIFSLAVSALALPANIDSRKTKGAASTAAAGASVLTVQDYADFQVSDGVAGNALDEVNAKFPVSTYLPID